MLGLILISACDICGTIGFVSGYLSGDVPVPLMAGYGATTLATVFVLPCTTFGMLWTMIYGCLDGGIDSLEDVDIAGESDSIGESDSMSLELPLIS